jgi:hypothetical protein
MAAIPVMAAAFDLVDRAMSNYHLLLIPDILFACSEVLWFDFRKENLR